MKKRSYRALARLDEYEERYEYLRLNDFAIGTTTFGSDRYLNQALYNSREWRDVRRQVVIRDDGCDLGIRDRPIEGRIYIHHINPITIEDIERGSPAVFDLNNLICASHITHNAIHFGSKDNLILVPPDRKRGDTCPWKVS